MEFQLRICPSCDRPIPRQVQECRCGIERRNAPRADPNPGPPADGGTTSFSRLVTAVVVIAVVAGATFWWTRPPAPVSTTTQAAAVVRVPPPDRPAISRETSLTTEFARLAPTGEDSAVPKISTATPAVPASLEDVISDVLPAVVSITAGQARGTGFFIKVDTILTNAHVVDGNAVVQFSTGDVSSSARVVTVHPAADIAVLVVETPNPRQRTLRLGSARNARVGEEVVAVGSALGVLPNTVTRGIVSAVRRAGDVTLLQTDAAINPGNSGGPLVNRSGEVIGINSMGVSKQAGEGLAFAVAIDHASALVISGRGIPAAVTSSQTPLTSLQQQMSGGRSDTDAERERGEQAYADAMLAASRAADSIDEYWSRYARECVVRLSQSGSRTWFAVLEPGAVEIGQSLTWNCSGWLDTVRKNAEAVRERVQQASETARQHGVYPGAVREVQRRYRLDSSGRSFPPIR